MEEYQPQYTELPSKDSGLMKWFLAVEQQIEEVAAQWRGEIKDVTGRWVKPKDPARANVRPIMSQEGVNWCYQFLKSTVGRVRMTSCYNQEFTNFVMREWVSAPLWNCLAEHYYDFGFKHESDMESVGCQIQMLILDVLLGARANGYRQFLTKTHQVQEISSTSNNGNERRGLFSMIGNQFNRKQGAEERFYNGG